jgi:methyl-accepting chemotaxis protein
MSDDSAFLPYRSSGVRMMLAALWVAWLAVVASGLQFENDKLAYAAGLGVLVLIAPTRGLITDRTDRAQRMSIGVAAAVMPALLVAMNAGRLWQMDLHMTFFVALAMLLPLCDWRPIALAGGLVAIHHLFLLYLVPEWVFSGSGSLGRVLLHGVLVAAQVGILAYITQRFRALVLASEGARREAERSRGDTQHALDDLRAAQLVSERRLADRHAVEATYAAERSERRAALAQDIQERVGAIAGELLDAAQGLGRHEVTLTGISSRLLRESQTLRDASERSLAHVLSVTASTSQLGQAAGDAGEHANAASRIVAETGRTVEGLEPRMVALGDEIAAARGILDLVSEIAAQSNLLALNATIEAARCGEAGKGFAVVAQEMKAMANRTSAATVQIAARLENIAGAAAGFAGTIEATMAHMSSVDHSTLAVSVAVQEQRQAIASIGRAAEAAMHDATATDDRSRLIGEAASENQAIAARAAELARLLDARARALGENMARLLDDLRAA